MMRFLQKLWPRSEPHLGFSYNVTFDDILRLFAEFCACISCIIAEIEDWTSDGFMKEFLTLFLDPGHKADGEVVTGSEEQPE